MHALDSSFSSQTTGSPRRVPTSSCGSTSALWTSRSSSRSSRGPSIHNSANDKAKYWPSKPTSWFKDVIDTEGIGQVDFRRFLAALRRHPGLQCALADAAGVTFCHDDRCALNRLHAMGPLGPSVEERTDILLKERTRVKQIFYQICCNADATLDLSSFLVFFRSRGLILDSM
jgi:hypothetical protein